MDSDVCLLLNSGFLAGQGQNQALWVASDYRNIPPGAIIINPQTGITKQDRKIQWKLLRVGALIGFLLNLLMIFLWCSNKVLSLLFVGQPYSNPDGSVYTHNPNLPLPNGQPPTSMYQTSEGWAHNSVTFYISVILFYGSVEATL